MTRLLMLALLAPATLCAQSGAFERDSTLDNLQHLPGYVTAPLGALGQVVRRGSGPVDVVIIAGWGFGAQDFDRFMRDHATRYRMLAVTLPGFAGTPAPPMPLPGTSYSERTWMRAAQQEVLALVRRENLRRPVLVGHFIVGSHIAVSLAHEHPELFSGLVLVGAEPMRLIQSREGAPRPPNERAALVDTSLASRWYKHVTRRTWLFNNYREPQYARDSARAAELWQTSADVPIAVMIRYICEYYTMDLLDTYRRLVVNTRVLVPSFSPEIFADSLQSYVRPLFIDAWAAMPRNSRIVITSVPDSRIFITDDQPRVVRDAIDAVAVQER